MREIFPILAGMLVFLLSAGLGCFLDRGGYDIVPACYWALGALAGVFGMALILYPLLRE